MTDPAVHELLSALLDREPVDPDALAATLERAEARALLIDFVRLRAVVHAVGATEPMTATRPPARRTLARPILQLAAAILLIALGVMAGHRLAPGDIEAPPEPSRIVPLVPAGGAR
jgi:hypothetical protein